MTAPDAPEGSSANRLDALRGDIDRIDSGIHGLIRERAEVVARLADLKRAENAGPAAGAAAFRPGREAQVLRRLIAAHGGPFPGTALLGMWRTMMAAFLRLQCPITVHVGATDGNCRLWDLARVHFGAETPLVGCSGTARALDACGEDAAALAVLPAPNGDDPWWLDLGEDGLMVLAGLPFMTRASVGFEAVIVARARPEPSGDDVTWLRLDGCADDGDVHAIARKAGLELSPVAAYKASRLVAAGRFLDAEDTALAAARDAAHTHGIRINRVGCLARPVRMSDGA
ncbi:MAG: chorismate mutase [Sphingomonadales bacterium]